MLLKRVSGEESLTRGHGLETVGWSNTLSGDLPSALKSLGTLKVRTSAGLYSDFLKETGNRVCMHVRSSAVDWRLTYNQPPLGEELALDSLIKAKIDQASALDEIKSLKAQIVSFENWDSNIERYKLAPLWNTGAVAYFTKESMNSSEPAHALCVNCYEQRKKHILHPKSVDGWIHIVCPSPSCDFDVAIGSKRAPKFEYVKG